MRPYRLLVLTTALGLPCCNSSSDDSSSSGADAGDAAGASFDEAADDGAVASPDAFTDDVATPKEACVTGDEYNSGGGPFVTATPEEIAVAGDLQGAFIEVDCESDEIELQFCHAKQNAVQDHMLRFGGQTGQTYSVVLGVWSVVEAVQYGEGTQLSDHVYLNGKDDTPSVGISGTSGRAAEYGLLVGPNTYYLNANVEGGEHYTYTFEYVTPPILIPGGSTIDFFIHSPDDLVNTNHMVNDVMYPPPGLLPKLERIHCQPLQGQFMYLEVQSVTAASADASAVNEGSAPGDASSDHSGG